MTAADVASRFREALPHITCLHDPGTLTAYGSDATGMSSAAAAIVFPQGIGDVKAVVDFANAQGVSLVPSGGRTGLSGGAVASNGEVVVSLSRMNRLLSMDNRNGLLHCEAGMTTAEVQRIARENDWYYPVDFASAGSSHIGGNIATNAGGIRVLRYGMTRERVVSLSVVTANGEIVRTGKPLHKDNSGYALAQWFIGSEGTLGIVCDAMLQLVTPPEPSILLLAVMDSLAVADRIAEDLQREGCVTALELMSHRIWLRNTVSSPLSPSRIGNGAAYLLVEAPQSLRSAGDWQEWFTARGVDIALYMDSHSQQAALWGVREGLSDSLRVLEPLKLDLSLPLGSWSTFIAETEKWLASVHAELAVAWFGHIGDGNLHFNVIGSQGRFPERVDRAQLEYDMCERVCEVGGSVSAEHGIGLRKTALLPFVRTPAEIRLMQTIKHSLDPRGILNPGKILSSEDTVQGGYR